MRVTNTRFASDFYERSSKYKQPRERSKSNPLRILELQEMIDRATERQAQHRVDLGKAEAALKAARSNWKFLHGCRSRSEIAHEEAIEVIIDNLERNIRGCEKEIKDARARIEMLNAGKTEE